MEGNINSAYQINETNSNRIAYIHSLLKYDRSFKIIDSYDNGQRNIYFPKDLRFNELTLCHQ